MHIFRKKKKGKVSKEKNSAKKTTVLQKLLQKLAAAGEKKRKSGKIKDGDTSSAHQYSGTAAGGDGPAHGGEGVKKSAEDQAGDHPHGISSHTSRVKHRTHACKLETADTAAKRKSTGLFSRQKKAVVETMDDTLPVEPE